MSFLSKKEVLASIKTRVQKVHGVDYTIFEAYFGTNPMTKKIVRKYAKTMAQMKDKISSFYNALERGGATAATLTPPQTYDASQAFDLLRHANVKLSLEDCVKIVLGRMKTESTKHEECASTFHTVGDAYDKYLKSVQDKSSGYQKDIRCRVGVWVMSYGRDAELKSVTAAAIKTYLMDKYYKKGDIGSWVSYNNALGNIKTFFAWCSNSEQGFLTANPVEQMKKITIPYRQPKYMKATDVRRLFDMLWERRNERLGAEDLAYSILSFFCGMRQSEVARVKLGEDAIKINLSERFIRVGIPKGLSKGIRPRTFAIPDQALAWMKAFDFMGGIMRPNNHLRERLAEMCKAHGVPLPKNAGRHTFITMFEAVHHDASALTAIVGNTDDVRAKSYNGVELRSEGEVYFKILPPVSDTNASS